MLTVFNEIIRNDQYQRISVLVFACFLSGCNTLMTPSTVTHQPYTLRPPQPSGVPAQPNGAIFQSINTTMNGVRYTPLFEDRRARMVGDTIIVNLREKTNASKSSESNVDRAGSIDFSVPNFLGLPLTLLTKNATIKANNNNKFNGGGASTNKNDFNGTITVTVIEALPNGNLVVSGEKQIGINQGQEFIRLSGVLNPVHIIGNTISSTQIADARIEYRGNGYVDEAQTMGWLSRFFLSISPF